MIHSKGELGQRSHMNITVHGDNAVPLSAYGENCRLRRIDDGIEAIRSGRTEVGETEGGALQLLPLQRAPQCAFNSVPPQPRQFNEPELINTVKDGNEQAIRTSDHDSDMSAVRRHDTG